MDEPIKQPQLLISIALAETKLRLIDPANNGNKKGNNKVTNVAAVSPAYEPKSSCPSSTIPAVTYYCGAIFILGSQPILPSAGAQFYGKDNHQYHRVATFCTCPS